MARRQTLGKIKANVQRVVNKYIRDRDRNGDKFKCISCGNIRDVRYMDAGHFYPIKGYDGIRFDLDNIHGECSRCNRFDDAHLIGYQINLEKKIGKKRLKQLHNKARGYKRNGYKFTRGELLEIKRKILEKGSKK